MWGRPNELELRAGAFCPSRPNSAKFLLTHSKLRPSEIMSSVKKTSRGGAAPSSSSAIFLRASEAQTTEIESAIPQDNKKEEDGEEQAHQSPIRFLRPLTPQVIQIQRLE